MIYIFLFFIAKWIGGGGEGEGQESKSPGEKKTRHQHRIDSFDYSTLFVFSLNFVSILCESPAIKRTTPCQAL